MHNMSQESISSMKIEAGAEFWVVVQMIWFEGTKKVSSVPNHLPWTHAHWLNSSHKKLSFYFKSLLSRLIMSIWKDWKNKSFGNGTTSRCYHLPTQVHELLIRWLFSMMLVGTGARKAWEFMEKVVLKLLGRVLQAREKCYQKKATPDDAEFRTGCC